MRKVRFTVERNEDFGYIGIVPNIFKNWDSYLPTTSPGHDLIDHTTKESGEVWQEFRALGANMFVHDFGRDRIYKFYSKNYIKNCAFETVSAIASTLEDAFNLDMTGEIPEAPKVSLSPVEKYKFKFFFSQMAWKIEAEANAYTEEKGGDFQPEWFDFWNKNRTEIENWFRVGFALAKRRYKGEAYYASQMKETLNRLFQNKMSELEDCVGEEFTLEFDVEENHASISNRWGLI